MNKNNYKNHKDHVLKPACVLLSNEQKRIMKHISKKLPGVSRPTVGSVNCFIQHAVNKAILFHTTIDMCNISSNYKSYT